jgi:hypothetical protein
MNVITDTLRQLVRRKLWPVAVVLVGALVAVPLMLAKSPESTAQATAANAGKAESLPATFVSADDPAATTKRRRVLGAAKDPFAPAELPKAKKKKHAKAKAKATDSETTGTKTDDTSSSGSGDTSSGSGGTATPPVAPQPTATPTPTIPAFSIKVRFGSTDGAEALAARTVERLSVLPDEENPLVVYRGIEDGGKVAVFELTGGIDAQGDGTCAPTPENCEYVKLRAGETEFFTVPAEPAKTEPTDPSTDAPTDPAATPEPQAQFQLDLVKIYKKATKEKAKAASTATKSLAKASSTSLSSKGFTLRRRNRYVFDAATGTLHRAAKGQKTPLSAL